MKNTVRCRIIALFMIFIFALASCVSFLEPENVKAAEAERKVVRVGYFEANNMMEGASEGEGKYGFAYDYLQKISYFTNWDYEYVYGDWNTIINKLYNGEVDIVADISKTPEREEKILFPDYAMGTENYYIYVHEDSPLVGKGIAGLNGATVGVNENSIMESMLINWNNMGNHNMQIIPYNGTEDRYNSFDYGKTVATVDLDISVLPEDHMIPMARIGSSDYYLAVSASRRDLLDELNEALGIISGINPGFTQELADKYFTNIAVNSKMTDIEKSWLADHNKLRVGYLNDYMPFSDTDDDGNVDGIVKDLMEQIRTELEISNGIPVEYTEYSSIAEMVQALKDGEIDVIFPVENDVAWADENDIYISEEVVATAMNLVFKGEYNSMRPKKIAVKAGNEIAYRYTVTHYPDAEIIEYSSIEECLEAVKNEKVDALVLNELRKQGYLNNDRFRMLNTISLVDNSSRSLAVAQGNNELLAILNRGISALPYNYAIYMSYKYNGNYAESSFRTFYEENKARIYTGLIIIALLIVLLVERTLNMKRRKDMLDKMAHKDSMTNLYNRRSFDEVMDDWHDKKVSKDTMVIAMDLNGLKKTNDTMGHEAGDELIIGAAECMNAVLGKYGKVFRIGGDEFAAIIKLDPSRHYEILRDLHRTFNNWQGNMCDSLSVAVGACSGDELEGLKPGDMVTMADERLYIQKSLHYNMMKMKEKVADQNQVNI